jgi:hypothetical protein
MTLRTLPLLALAALSITSLAKWRQVHQRRQTAKPQSDPQPLQVWEGEGGGLPDGGPGPTARGRSPADR